MPESEALMTGKGCEQVTSEDCLGKDRSQALRYTDCAVVRSQGIGLRWAIWMSCSNWHPNIVSASQGLALGN